MVQTTSPAAAKASAGTRSARSPLIRHGSSSERWINVLALTVSDDGVGFDVDAAWGDGLGLISMGERIEAIGGTLDIRSTPGGGTCLTIRVPLPKERAAELTMARKLG